MSLDLSKVSGLDCIPVVVLTNYEPELSYILAEFFNMCLKKSCFLIVGRSHWWALYLRMLRKGLQLKTTTLLVFFWSLVKSFKKLVNNSLLDHLEKCGLFSHLQFGFKSSQLTADLLIVLSNRIARGFNRCGVTQAVALDISKTFDRVCSDRNNNQLLVKTNRKSRITDQKVTENLILTDHFIVFYCLYKDWLVIF